MSRWSDCPKTHAMQTNHDIIEASKHIIVEVSYDIVKGHNRGQITLLPDCIDDLIGLDNPVRVIDAFIDGLNMEEAGFQRSIPNTTGRPSYDPRDLLKLYVYGYFNKIRSSRKLITECSRNIELFFLLNRLTPDFRIIADFRKDNAKALRNVFRTFVKICLNLNLYKNASSQAYCPPAMKTRL